MPNQKAQERSWDKAYVRAQESLGRMMRAFSALPCSACGAKLGPERSGLVVELSFDSEGAQKDIIARCESCMAAAREKI